MSIKNPYYRMLRENKRDGYFGHYPIDPRNILDWNSSIRALGLIVEDFKRVCEYIEPCDENSAVFSHRIYELFVRSCTELESNMKAILKANGYTGKTRGKRVISAEEWNINDYKKLEPVLKLSSYEVLINFLNNGRGLKCVPFRNWASGKSGKLVWYQNYNEVKHSREEKFHLASWENLIPSICGLFVLLFSQYGIQVFNPYQVVNSYTSGGRMICHDSSIFGVLPPVWQDEEKYDFNWDIISAQKNPFKKFKSF